jgi:NitT/TauT family transport system substrate-binding protein
MKRKISRVAVIINIIYIIIFTGCVSTGQKKDNDLSLRFDWIPTMAFAGDIVAANNLSTNEELNLILRPAGEGIDPIKMVISGVDDIGVVSLERLLMANERGADLIALGIVDYITPTVFLSKKAHNIQSPHDFYGKRIGVQSGGATEFVYRTLIKKMGINERNLTELRIGFDMRPFVENQYDIRPGFITDEAVFLQLNNIEFNIIEPKDFGLNYPGRVYFTTQQFFQNNYQILQSFIFAVAQGWEYAIANPESAIDQLNDFEKQINREKELIGLIKGKEYFSGHNEKILMPDQKGINEMIEYLYGFGLLTKKPVFDDYFYLGFINKYHEFSLSAN